MLPNTLILKYLTCGYWKFIKINPKKRIKTLKILAYINYFTYLCSVKIIITVNLINQYE